jgi:hypothetical protein
MAKSKWMKNFFFPPAERSIGMKILPYAVVIIAFIVLLVAVTVGWEVTNSTEFCGLACHTMPPQYITHENATHNRVTCEECHLGRANLATQIPRKIQYSWQTGSALVFNTYEYPIRATTMRPAVDACETCHYPETFSGDKLLTLDKFAADEQNSKTTVSLLLKTGGGSQREGLGSGIHWHIENPVYFYTDDPEKQVIPYIRVTNTDGTITEYVDVESGFDVSSIQSSDLEYMDCNTCHNRTSHQILSPSNAMDQMLSRGLISASIPEIKKKGEEVLTVNYETDEAAAAAIAGLETYYQENHSDFYAQNTQLVKDAVAAIQAKWEVSGFIEQEMFWNTHPDNIGHETAPGCFRCHDGKHLTAEKEAVRLECNLCHSIPVVSKDTDLVTKLEISRSGIEPQTHLNTNWITLHNQAFDSSCQGCHTVTNPGGADNTSFCSNSACHGSSWSYAGFDAPALRDVLKDQLPTAPIAPTQVATLEPGGQVSWSVVGDLLKSKCGMCHGEAGTAGLTLISYEGLMKGSSKEPVVIPGDAANSVIVKVQQAGHPVQLTADELNLLIEWINAGAVQ